jgi:universal stress protein E
MTKTPRILVVVDPTANTHPALRRAARVAGSLGWGLDLLICLQDGLPPRLPVTDPRTVRRTLLAAQLRRLQELGHDCAGLSVQAKVVWDRPLHEAIIRETLRSESRLVMKDTHFHSAISRALITNTDWHLIRECPAPLWLVRSATWADKPIVTAFVDPLHENDKPAELDHHILREAALFAGRLGGAVHAVHCFDAGSLNAAATAGPEDGAGHPESIAAQMQADHAAKTAELAATHGIAPDHVHLHDGAVVDSIPAAARQLSADLAVMGAVARSRIAQAFLGHTAEQVLDRLPCDVLVVKPARFESPVTYRAQAPDFMELH